MEIAKWLGTLLFIFVPVFGSYTQAARGEDPIVAGFIEKAWFNDKKFSLKAKLDTGAKSSSIHAPDYEIFKRKGERWVRFEIVNAKGKRLTINRKVSRFVRIRRAGVEMRRRPVVRMSVCVGGKTGVAEFTLAERSEMNYQVLIGRNFLSKRVLVDPGRTFLNSNKCIQKE